MANVTNKTEDELRKEKAQKIKEVKDINALDSFEDATTPSERQLGGIFRKTYNAAREAMVVVSKQRALGIITNADAVTKLSDVFSKALEMLPNCDNVEDEN